MNSIYSQYRSLTGKSYPISDLMSVTQNNLLAVISPAFFRATFSCNIYMIPTIYFVIIDQSLNIILIKKRYDIANDLIFYVRELDKMMQNNGYTNTLLFLMCSKKFNKKFIKILISNNFNINIIFPNGDTCLEAFLRLKRRLDVNVIKLLINCGMKRNLLFSPSFGSLVINKFQKMSRMTGTNFIQCRRNLIEYIKLLIILKNEKPNYYLHLKLLFRHFKYEILPILDVLLINEISRGLEWIAYHYVNGNNKVTKNGERMIKMLINKGATLSLNSSVRNSAKYEIIQSFIDQSDKKEIWKNRFCVTINEFYL